MKSIEFNLSRKVTFFYRKVTFIYRKVTLFDQIHRQLHFPIILTSLSDHCDFTFRLYYFYFRNAVSEKCLCIFSENSEIIIKICFQHFKMLSSRQNNKKWFGMYLTRSTYLCLNIQSKQEKSSIPSGPKLNTFFSSCNRNLILFFWLQICASTIILFSSKKFSRFFRVVQALFFGFIKLCRTTVLYKTRGFARCSSFLALVLTQWQKIYLKKPCESTALVTF